MRITDQSLPTAQTATATISITIDPAIVPAAYVANGGNGTVTSYAIGGSGNLAPLTTFGEDGLWPQRSRRDHDRAQRSCLHRQQR